MMYQTISNHNSSHSCIHSHSSPVLQLGQLLSIKAEAAKPKLSALSGVL
jgi:hypothetical protein